MSRKILVVESDLVIRSNICNSLIACGHEVAEACDSGDAQAKLEVFHPDAAIIEIASSNSEHFLLLHRIKSQDWSVPVIVLVSSGGRELGLRATREGADQYFAKPVDVVALQTELLRLVMRNRSRQGSAVSLGKAGPRNINPFLGSSAAIRNLEQVARRVLHSSSPVLLQGETGSGKGVLANWIHCNGPRAGKAFLDLNCAGLSRELLESELFGHAKGAFTSAISAKPGLLEIADHGTVFLDEIGDMDQHVQPKLLKVLEERVFRRLGDIRDQAVDIRLISATHRELHELVREGRFREDLYYRMNTVPIRMPALRERQEDIPLLVEQFVRELAENNGRTEIVVDSSAKESLQSRTWPGNIRELRNVLERAVLLAESNHLTVRDLEAPDRVCRTQPPRVSGCETLKEMERAYIHHVLHDEQGSIERSAKRLGIPRSSLYNKMKRFEIPQGTGRIQP